MSLASAKNAVVDSEAWAVPAAVSKLRNNNWQRDQGIEGQRGKGAKGRLCEGMQARSSFTKRFPLDSFAPLPLCRFSQARSRALTIFRILAASSPIFSGAPEALTKRPKSHSWRHS